MKKTIPALLMVCIMSIVISACGSSSGTANNTTSADTAKETMTETAAETTTEESKETTVETEEVTEESVEESLLSVVGIFYGDLYQALNGRFYKDQELEGFSDCIVVFDYTNDATNRTLPESSLEPGKLYSGNITCPDITLLVNDTNKYEAYDPNSYYGHYSNKLNRYTSYSNPIGYGNLLGGSAPVRMYAVFYVNPNELEADSSAVLTVDDQTVEFSFEDIKEIKYPDEILTCEENYEELQQIAAFKWRMDKTVDLAGDVDHYMVTISPGNDLAGIGYATSALFSTDYGQSISGTVSVGFDMKTHLFDGVNTDLPLFNVDVLTSTFPEQANDITGIIDATNTLGAAVQDSSYGKNDIEDILKEIIGYYTNLTSAFDMEIYKE